MKKVFDYLISKLKHGFDYSRYDSDQERAPPFFLRFLPPIFFDLLAVVWLLVLAWLIIVFILNKVGQWSITNFK